MEALNISEAVRASTSDLVLARSRRLAAVIALLFPAVVVFFILAALIKNGLNLTGLLEHGVLLALLPPGLGALVVWCRRYTRPALRAVSQSRPICLQDGQLVIQGNRFPVEDATFLRYNRSVVELVTNGHTVARFPGFFIEIAPSTQRKLDDLT